VNEVYFHVATGAQVIYWMTHLPGRANPLPILASHGVVTMVIVFIFQIIGGLAGASFISKIFWKQGFIPFHQGIVTGQVRLLFFTFFRWATVVTPGLLQNKCQKSVTVRGMSGFSSVFSRIFFRKYVKKSQNVTVRGLQSEYKFHGREI